MRYKDKIMSSYVLSILIVFGPIIIGVVLINALFFTGNKTMKILTFVLGILLGLFVLFKVWFGIK